MCDDAARKFANYKTTLNSSVKLQQNLLVISRRSVRPSGERSVIFRTSKSNGKSRSRNSDQKLMNFKELDNVF